MSRFGPRSIRCATSFVGARSPSNLLGLLENLKVLLGTESLLYFADGFGRSGK